MTTDPEGKSGVELAYRDRTEPDRYKSRKAPVLRGDGNVAPRDEAGGVTGAVVRHRR
jgi:hypothetical protein